MAYLETYAAYAKHHDHTKNQEWPGLTKGQAKWRYHWLARNYTSDMKEWGWKRELSGE